MKSLTMAARMGCIVLGWCTALHAGKCDSLTRLAIPNTTILSAGEVAAGPFALGGRAGSSNLPPFCRVMAMAKPAPGSEIHVEVWLPAAAAWNRKFAGTGNGGYSSALSYRDMAAALLQGYATAGTDTGHDGGDLKFAIGHPERIDDWGWRSIHVMTQTAKLIVRGYYGMLAERSYFQGCSTGGHQALSEAQRFPADYDGIVAGDPGNNRVRLNVGFLWSWLAANPANGDPLPAAKLPLIHRAAVEACDALDGVRDGAIDDPRACRFDPAALLCKGDDNAACLTAAQAAAVRKIYDGAHNPRTGERLFAGWPRGSEEGWTAYFVGQREPARLDFWRYWVFGDPEWNARTFDFDGDVAFSDAAIAAAAATSVDLAAFQKRGGKLLAYHGTADPVSPPEDSIGYYEHVRDASGGEQKMQSFYRLFLVPGMGHCGPAEFDALAAVDRWASQGVAPDRLAVKGADGRTRSLCPFPQVGCR